MPHGARSMISRGIRDQCAVRCAETVDLRGTTTLYQGTQLPRSMTLRPEREHHVLHARRQEQDTPAWKKHYDKRAGIEGTLSQGIRAFGLRQCRYRGLPKTRLQHLAIAAAINMIVWRRGWMTVLMPKRVCLGLQR